MTANEIAVNMFMQRSVPQIDGRGRSFYYDRETQPISQAAWETLNRQRKYTRIKCDSINGYRVSTIWMGMDHGYDQILIFETMVFADAQDETAWQDLYCDRYSTEEEAIAGHDAIVKQIADGKTFDSAQKD